MYPSTCYLLRSITDVYNDYNSVSGICDYNPNLVTTVTLNTPSDNNDNNVDSGIFTIVSLCSAKANLNYEFVCFN